MEIPRPSCLDMGISMGSAIEIQEEIDDDKPLNFIPSLSDLCLQQVSLQIVIHHKILNYFYFRL